MAKPKSAKRVNKIDEEVEETFPASDPPAFMNGIIGAPPRGKSVKKASTPTKKKAKKKRK